LQAFGYLPIPSGRVAEQFIIKMHGCVPRLAESTVARPEDLAGQIQSSSAVCGFVQSAFFTVKKALDCIDSPYSNSESAESVLSH